MNKKIILIVLAVLVLILGYWIWKSNQSIVYFSTVKKLNDSTYLVKWDKPTNPPAAYKIEFESNSGKQAIYQSNTLESVVIQNSKNVKNVNVFPHLTSVPPLVAEVDIDIISFDAGINISTLAVSSDILTGPSGLITGSEVNTFLDNYNDDCLQLGSIKYKLNYMVSDDINYTEAGNAVTIQTTQDVNQDQKIDQEVTIKNMLEVLPQFNGTRKNHVIRRWKCN